MEEKIKINLSYRTYSILLEDMETFHFTRKEKVNRNAFLNTLITNYYPYEKKALSHYSLKMEEVFSSCSLSGQKSSFIKENLLSSFPKRGISYFHHKKDYSLSFRPNKKCSYVLSEIEEKYLEYRSLSDFLRTLLEDYVSFSPAEREIILFHDEVEIIEEALKKKTCLYLKLNAKKVLFRPFAFVTTKEEYFSYLVGMVDKSFYSLHLYKLSSLCPSSYSANFSSAEKEKLDQIVEQGADYFLREKIKIKIILTKQGKKMFRTFWHNRPEMIESSKDYDVVEDPYDRLFNYFLRFGKEVKILEPLSFQEALFRFYKTSISTLKEENETL